MDWIDVNKEEPKNRQEVLILDSHGLSCVCYFRLYMNDFVADHHTLQFKKESEMTEFDEDCRIITHWQPIDKKLKK